jgi:uncharacterized protein YuzE
MRSLYDRHADAFYLRFTESPIVESDEVADGVILDLDSDGRIVAIEFLGASNRLAVGAV